jgi:mannose-6-phosphate isomerase-like protein (cupin superfamily)
MDKVNLAEKFARFDDHWSPKVIGELNDSYVKAVKVKGELPGADRCAAPGDSRAGRVEFVWHHHEHEDELFLVVKGRLLVRLRDREVSLEPGEFFIVPKGVEHMPVAPEEVHVVLLEPKTTLNTGNVRNERTVDREARI